MKRTWIFVFVIIFALLAAIYAFAAVFAMVIKIALIAGFITLAIYGYRKLIKRNKKVC